MRLLVYTTGEADLLLDSQATRDEDIRATRMEARRSQLVTALAQPDGLGAARRLLDEGSWADEYPSTEAPSPLLAIFKDLGHTPDLRVLILGTRQDPACKLDTYQLAQTLAEALKAGVASPATANPVREVEVVPVGGMTEAHVVEALTEYVADPSRYEQTLVAWGWGPMALTMGALTALSQAGHRWQLVAADGTTTPDPLAGLDTDPVIGVLVRWRMFAALEELGGESMGPIQLTEAQRELIRAAAERHREGFTAKDSGTLRAVLADAVVRRDGSASLAVRRYITRRYKELLVADKVTHPDAVNLFHKATKALREEGFKKPTLGKQLGWIRENVVCDLPSYQWLADVGPGSVVEALQRIGKGSHRLTQPNLADATIVGEYLLPDAPDGSNWPAVGLPQPPLMPAVTVLALWLAGNRPNHAGTVAKQLIDCLPPALCHYVGTNDATLNGLIFGVPGVDGSLDHAQDEAQLLLDEGREAWAESIETPDLEQAIERRLTPGTAALLYVPTGRQAKAPDLIRAMRRVAARNGLSLFVRQIGKPTRGKGYAEVYQWPALVGGDLPLLVAAREALQALELDVAWRLLAASGIDAAVTENARRLADTFASRRPTGEPATDPGPAGIDLIAQRLDLVDAALAKAKLPADRIRLLVLAADVLEASIAATQPSGLRPGEYYKRFRENLQADALRSGTSGTQSARILLLLNEARDRAPVTHGTESDPDDVVVEAASVLTKKWSLDAARLPRDVATLVMRAAEAAEERNLGRRDAADSLRRRHERICVDISLAIVQRSRHGSEG